MGLFENLGLMLKGSVGNMMDNDEDDVVRVKDALHQTGYRAGPAQNVIIEQETDDAIRKFQREKGLKVDGYLMPGGESEGALKKALGFFAKNSKNILPSTSRNLKHYLEKSGKDLVLSEDDMDREEVFKLAQENNRKRFENSFLDSDHPFNSQLKSISDKQTIILRNKDGKDIDHWDFESGVKSTNKDRNPLKRFNLDEYLSSGTNKIRSSGKFKATRIGNKVSLIGVVDHDWNDKYDFDPNSYDGKIMSGLEKRGEATVYNVRAKKSKNLLGVLDIENGELKNPKYYWFDK